MGTQTFCMLATPSADDLRELIRLHEIGKLQVTIDSSFPMEQAAQAHRRIEAGVDHGKVVLIHAPSKDALSSKTL